MIETVRDVALLRHVINSWRAVGHRIALVPTMGALHQGHLDLIAGARTHATKVVASVFVNPAQFAPHEDLARYPRNELRDADLLAQAGCDLLYAPDNKVMYPEGFSTHVEVSGVSARWEGTFRPQFFSGVATVVTKLLLQARPNVAMFGEKDWQQLQVVTKLVADLDIETAIIGVTTRREDDGLAMSSRNAYLSPDQRRIAPALARALNGICDAIVADQADIAQFVEATKLSLIGEGFASIDYLAPCHAYSLEPWRRGDPVRVLGAAWLGQTRLIDNCGP